MNKNKKLAVLLILIFIVSLVSTSGAISVKAATTITENDISKSSSSEGGKDKKDVTINHDSDETVAVGLETHKFGDLSYLIREEGIEITECKESVTNVEIPSSIGGVSVTKIGNDAFAGCRELTSVNIPNTVKKIEDWAFEDCVKLKNVVIPDSVISTGSRVFEGCTGLCNIKISNELTGIADYLFTGCISLNNVQIPSSVTSIGDYAFRNCTSLSNIKISSGVTSIGHYAFHECAKLTDISIPSSVTNIDLYAFGDESNLNNIVVDQENKNYSSENGILYNRDKTELVLFPQGRDIINFLDSVKIIGDAAFHNNTKLSNIQIPSHITSMGKCAFLGCTNLSKIDISSSVTAIGSYAFEKCTSLSSIVIPSSVTNIGSCAFTECSSLNNIVVDEGNAKYSSEDGILYNKDKTYLEAYSPGKSGDVKIASSVKKIRYCAFYKCNKLNRIQIPDGVEDIAERAFYGCSNLRSIIIPKSVGNIDSYAFLGCDINNLIIYGYKGSEAEKYAKYKNIKFVVLNTGVNSTDSTYGNGNFFVFDANTKSPIEGATVTLSQASNKTDSKGAADFSNPKLKDGTYNLKITKDGYRDYIFNEYDYYTTNADVGYLKPIIDSDKDRPYISSVILKDSITCSKEDILLNSKNYQTSSLESCTITINASGDKSSSAAEYSLLQNGKVILKNNTGIFKSITPAKIFSKNAPIYVVVKYKDGKVSDAEKTNLNIYEATSQANGNIKLSLGNKIKLPVEKEVPILGNMNLEMGFEDLPAKFESDGKTFKITIDPSAKIEYEVFPGAEITGSAEGNIEGTVDAGTLVPTTGKITVTLDSKFSKDNQFLVGPVPVCIEFEVGASAKFCGGLTYDNKTKSLNIAQNLELTIPHVQVSGGVGVAGFLNVRAYGSGDMKYSKDYSSKEENLNFTASMGIIAQALTFEYKVQIASKTWDIYPGDKKLSAGNNAEINSPSNIYDKTQYSLASRDYINNPSEWLGDSKKKNNLKASYTNEEVKTLQTNIYPDSKPKMAVVGGKKVMVWLQDNKERSSINRTMLVYSVYDKNTDTCSQPKAVDDDKTADFYPSISSDGTNLYVAWHNTKTTLSDDVSINDMAANGEIEVSKFNTKTNLFEGQKTLTNNNTLDTQPHVVVDNGKVAVVWTNNSNNDIFGTSGSNSIMYSELSGSTWTTPKALMSNQKAIVGLNVGYMSGKLTTAFVTDSDNDLNTTQDRDIFIIKPGQAVQNLTNNQVLDSNPTFSKFNGITTLFWYSDGNIKYTSDLSAKPSIVFTTSPVGLTDDFEVVTNSSVINSSATNTPSTSTPATTSAGKTAILWTKAEDKNNEIYSSIYDYAKKSWSDDVKISNVGARVMCPNGIFDENGNFMIAFKKTTVNDDNTLGQFDLCTIKVVPSYNLSVDKVTYDDTKLAPSVELPIEVDLTNKGELSVDRVKVEVLDGTNVISTKTITQSLKPGESATIDSSFSLPSTISKKNYTIKVTPVNGSEYDLSDNTKDITVGYADLGIKIDKYYVGDHQMITAKVFNSSYIKSGAVLNVREDTPDGKIIASKTIDSLEYGQSVTNIFDIDSELVNYADSQNVKAIYFTVDNVADELKTEDNSYFIAVDKPSDAPVIDNFITDVQSPQIQGTKITLVTTSSGGKGALQTKFEINDGTGTTVLKDFSDAKNLEWTPDKAGTYAISATVKDENGKTTTKTITYKVDKVLTINTFGANLASPQTLGTKLTLSTNAEGHGTIQYRFVVTKDGKSVFVRDYNTTNTATWTPTEAGTYTIYVKVKDDSGKEVTKSKSYVVNKALVIKSYGTDLKSPQVKQTKIELTTVADGQGKVIYKFSVTKDGKSVFTKDYSTTNTTTWTPTEAGTYTLYFKVNDDTGKEVTKTMTYVVK